MKVIGDIMHPTGKYMDRKTQEEKTRWLRIGTLMQNAEGNFRIKLDASPVGGDGWLAVFDNNGKPKPSQGTAGEQPTGEGSGQDKIPF